MDAVSLARVTWKNNLQVWGALVNGAGWRRDLIKRSLKDHERVPDDQVTELRRRVVLVQPGLAPQLDNTTKETRTRLEQLYDSNVYVARELREFFGCTSPEDAALSAAEQSAAAGADSARAADQSMKAAGRMVCATVVLAIGTLAIVGLQVYELWCRAAPLPAATGGG